MMEQQMSKNRSPLHGRRRNNVKKAESLFFAIMGPRPCKEKASEQKSGDAQHQK